MAQSDSPVVTLRVDEETRVGTISFNRPPLNAYNHEFMTDLRDCIEAAGSDPRVRVVVVTSEIPGFFCAGADAKAFQAMTAEKRFETAQFDNIVTDMLARLDKPTIAAVNGVCFGGGLEIALACDFIFLALARDVGLPEVKLGLMPGNGGTQRLPRRIGRRALRYLMTGESIKPRDALAWGLVDELVDPDRLNTEVAEFAKVLAGQPPLALAAIKRAVLQGMELPLFEGLALEAAELEVIFASNDAQEGLDAFFEKPRRDPVWTGT